MMSGRTSMTGLRKEVARLKEGMARQAAELEALRAENARLRAARATHAMARFGRRSEKRGRSGSGRRRGHGWSAATKFTIRRMRTGVVPAAACRTC